MTTNPATGGTWVPDLTSFGSRLALVRQRMGWGNVKEAALACGLPVSSWRNWERDGRQPRDYMTACQQVAQRTGVDLAWLAMGPRAGVSALDLSVKPNNDTYPSPARPTAKRGGIVHTHGHGSPARAA